MLHRCKSVAVIAFTLTFAIAVVAQPRAKGPWVGTNVGYASCPLPPYCEISNGAIYVWTEGMGSNMKVHMSYIYDAEGWTYNGMGYQHEFFDGYIPNSSLTVSGHAQFNGGYTVSVNVNTSLIQDPSKVGSGGWINLTWTQKPMGRVERTIGSYTQEDVFSIFHQTGTLVSMENQLTGFVRWADIPPVPPISFYSSSLDYADQTFFTRTPK
jgi:hypothetical protein